MFDKIYKSFKILITKFFLYKKCCPQYEVSVFSRFTHWWMTSLIIKGNRQDLNKEDLWVIDENELSEYLTERVEKHWNAVSDKLELN